MRTIEELSKEVDLLWKKVEYVDGKEVGLADRFHQLEERLVKVEQKVNRIENFDLTGINQEIVWLKEKVANHYECQRNLALRVDSHETDIQRLFTKFANMEVGKCNAELQKSVTRKIIISLE